MNKDNKDFALIVALFIIIWLCFDCLYQSFTNVKQGKMIRELQEQNDYLTTEISFVEEVYNEQIVMLDSQSTLLEAEILELREELNSIKK